MKIQLSVRTIMESNESPNSVTLTKVITERPGTFAPGTR